jgi:hypothetical protein
MSLARATTTAGGGYRLPGRSGRPPGPLSGGVMPVLPPDRPFQPQAPGRRRRRPAGDPRPLPDPAAVRLCRIPDSAPPYDSEPAPSPPPAPAYPPGTAAPPGPAPAAGRANLPRPGSAAGPLGRPAAPAWPGYFAQVLAETLAGVRPATQLVPWTTERARSRIQQLGPRLAAGQRPRIRRVVIFRPAPDAMEVTVVVAFGPRVHALALRLERGDQPGRWLCTTVEAA